MNVYIVKWTNSRAHCNLYLENGTKVGILVRKHLAELTNEYFAAAVENAKYGERVYLYVNMLPVKQPGGAK